MFTSIPNASPVTNQLPILLIAVLVAEEIAFLVRRRLGKVGGSQGLKPCESVIPELLRMGQGGLVVEQLHVSPPARIQFGQYHGEGVSTGFGLLSSSACFKRAP